MARPDLKSVVSFLYGLPFIWVGVQHFVQPAAFVPIVPPYLGWPEFWVHITGWTEIGLGIGVMVPRVRRLAARLMILQLGLLYLANLHMWMNDVPFEGHRFGVFGHSVRLLIQVALMGVAWWIGRDEPEATAGE